MVDIIKKPPEARGNPQAGKMKLKQWDNEMHEMKNGKRSENATGQQMNNTNWKKISTGKRKENLKLQ